MYLFVSNILQLKKKMHFHYHCYIAPREITQACVSGVEKKHHHRSTTTRKDYMPSTESPQVQWAPPQDFRLGTIQQCLRSLSSKCVFGNPTRNFTWPHFRFQRVCVCLTLNLGPGGPIYLVALPDSEVFRFFFRISRYCKKSLLGGPCILTRLVKHMFGIDL